MKKIVYQREIPALTIETPEGETVVVRESYLQKESLYFTAGNKDAQIAEALKYSYNGEYEIVDDGEPEPNAPISDQVKTAMMAFAATSTSIPDSYALDMPDLFPVWEDLLAAGSPLAKGTILRGGEQLYRVNQDNVTPQAHQPPSSVGMTAVYVPINRSNAGTMDDPIPAVRGMEYTYGLYYLDPEDQKIYLCRRTGESDGGVVTLQYLPHEQTPHYFEAV